MLEEQKRVIWPAMLARRKFKLLFHNPDVVEFLGGKLTNELANE